MIEEELSCNATLMLTLLFTVSSNSKRVGSEGGLDLGVSEMQDMAVIFDHVHLLNALNTVHTQLL